MGSNLIQNYIAAKPIVNQPVLEKPKPDFDIQHELDNRTFIKPLKGKGRLVSGNIFSAPRHIFDGTVYNAKAFVHAMKGEANDHELGRLNDVGLWAGGLTIASFLAAKRTTPMTKGMEFVGFGAFLASMAVWPKIAIQLPAYLIHGVNVQQKYQDSFGRTKPFYQDPQFIPWDLYSDEEIQKIGNRMGVPKDIPNRRDFIQEKMRKLAVQNNTLWMLTAGFATPVMTALACNATEPYLANYLNNAKNKKADRILQNLEKYSKKYQTHPIEKKLKDIIKIYGDRPLNDELVELLTETFTNDLDSVTSDSFRKDLKSLILTGEYTVTENTGKNIANNLQAQFKGKDFSEDFLKAVLPDEERLNTLFKEKGFLNKNFEPSKFRQVSDEIVKDIIRKSREFNKDLPPDEAKDIEMRLLSLINNRNKESHPIIKALYEAKAGLFDTTVQAKLTNAAKIFDDFRARNLALDEYALIKVGSAPETVIANYWNDISNHLIKTLGITQKEIEKVRFDRNLMGALLREKIEKIVSDKSSYEKVMTELVEKVASLNTQIKTSDMTTHVLRTNDAKTNYEKKVDDVFKSYSDSIRNSGFTRTAEAINGDYASYKNIQKAYVEERLLGVKSSFSRLINTFDFYRRVASNPNGMTAYDNLNLVREVKEELIELCKIVSLEGHASDHATKFYMLRNPHPNPDMSALEVKDGKIVNKYLGKTKAGLTDIPGDKYFYQNAMKFMFEDDLHPETKAILEKSILKDEISNYRRLILEKIGGDRYFWKPRHLVRSRQDTSTDIKSLLVGIAPDEFFFKSGQQFYNTKKWLKIFGGFGAGLLGVTVLAQFLLGKLKAPEVKK